MNPDLNDSGGVPFEGHPSRFSTYATGPRALDWVVPHMSKSFTLKEAATALGISVSSVRRRVLSQEISAERAQGPYGEQWVLSPDAFQKLADLVHAEGSRSEATPPKGEQQSSRAKPELSWTTPERAQSSSFRGSAIPEDTPLLNEVGRPPQETRSRPHQLDGKGLEGPVEPTPSEVLDDTPFVEAPSPDPLLKALEVASLALRRADALEERLEEANQLAERERRRNEVLNAELNSYRRALAESAESLAEQRAAAMEERSKRIIEVQQAEALVAELKISTPTADSTGWGKLRKWLGLGRKTG